MYLIDTNVLSALSPDAALRSPGLVQWVSDHDSLCHISVVTLTELSYGVAWLRHRDAMAKAARLGLWLSQVYQFDPSRILLVDPDIAMLAGTLRAKARAADGQPDIADAWIAATAQAHNLEVLTFNLADFQILGMACRDPTAQPPPP